MSSNNSAIILDEDSIAKELRALRSNVSIAYIVLKRIMDIVCSLLGIIVLSPLFLLIAILIKIEDPKGKVFFGQERNGQYPRKFKMLKFRSMVHNAEELLDELQHLNEQSGPAFKIKDYF